MVIGGSDGAAPRYQPTTKAPSTAQPAAAQPSEGAYQADQAAAEQAYQEAQAQLQAQRQMIFHDYGLDANGNYTGDQYSQYGEIEHNYGDQLYQLNTQNDRFNRDTGIAQQQNQHGLDTLLSQLSTQQGRTQTDADTQLSRLGRDYGLDTSDLEKQIANVNQDYGYQRQDELQSYADRMDAARAAGIGRGFKGGLAGAQSRKLAASLTTDLGRLNVQKARSLDPLLSQQTRLANSYGDTTSDVRTQLSRAMEDIGTQRSSGQYDFTQRANELANALADQSADYGHNKGNVEYGYNLNKSNLAEAFAEALAANSSDQLSASRQLAQAKIDARTKYAQQAVTNNQQNLQSLLAAFGL